VANGVRINTGNDDYLPLPAEHTFTLRYRTTRQLGFFAEHDELYFNAIGTGWAFPIDAARVEVRLPQAVLVGKMSVEGYTGYQGSSGSDYRAEIPAPGVARWYLTRPLNPQEGLTIVVTFPKGLVPEPTPVRRAVWLLNDNLGVLVALAGFILLILFCVREWRRVGRDPAKGVVIARYEPPEGHTPASLRYVRRMGYDMRCFSAEVLALAVAGLIRIVHEDGLFKDDWRLERDSSAAGSLTKAQRALLRHLFPGGKQTLELKKTSATTVAGAKSAHSSALEEVSQPRYFKHNGPSIVKALVIAALSGIAAFLIAQGSGVPAIVAICVLMALTLLVFVVLVRAPTAEGRKLMDEVEGLKLYLTVAEREELASMQGPAAPPHLDAKRYEHLLPFAVALEVEDAWTDKFTAAVGAATAAEATRNIAWYRGGGMSDLSSLSRAVGSSLTSQISSASTPPGSSSGSGGGGSSGGGGGGGGGGGR
jgi:uncharacterized membrane protein YgcG